MAEGEAFAVVAAKELSITPFEWSFCLLTVITDTPTGLRANRRKGAGVSDYSISATAAGAVVNDAGFIDSGFRLSNASPKGKLVPVVSRPITTKIPFHTVYYHVRIDGYRSSAKN